jgi:hypothetical protein
MFVALVDDNRVEIESLMRKSHGRCPAGHQLAAHVLLTPECVDRGRCGNKMLSMCRPGRRHISFRPMINRTGRTKAELVKPDIAGTEP